MFCYSYLKLLSFNYRISFNIICCFNISRFGRTLNFALKTHVPSLPSKSHLMHMFICSWICVLLTVALNS